MNVLVIGNNPKHAKLFSMFSDNVSILLQEESDGVNRVSKELFDYNLLYSEIRYGTLDYKINRHKELRNIIVERNIDIVFSNRRDDMVQAKIATLCMRKKPLLLVTFHNSTAWVNDSKVKLMSMLINVCTNGCICLASFMYDKLVKNGVKKRKLLFLPNTIQYENFTVKDDYSLKSDVVKICYTAVIYPLKNQRIIIEVVNSLKSKYKFEVHLYGDYLDTEYYDQLMNQIKEYGLENEVFLDGRVDNDAIREMLPQNDLYISSTTIEMSPYNILEAKASGLPVLASNVLGQKDLIEDGEDGVLYDVDDLSDLKNKLDLLLSNREFREKIGKKAREVVSSSKSYLVASEKLKTFISTL